MSDDDALAARVARMDPVWADRQRAEALLASAERTDSAKLAAVWREMAARILDRLGGA